jgi:hypothetical protein
MRKEATSNARRHLLTKHKINLNASLSRKRSRQNLNEENEALREKERTQIKGLLVIVKAETFRTRLIRWIVECSIPFRSVESSHFQELLTVLNPGVERYLVKIGNTIRRWIEADFMEAKGQIR